MVTCRQTSLQATVHTDASADHTVTWRVCVILFQTDVDLLCRIAVQSRFQCNKMFSLSIKLTLSSFLFFFISTFCSYTLCSINPSLVLEVTFWQGIEYHQISSKQYPLFSNPRIHTMARFSFMICFAVILAVLNQSTQVEALPARRFGMQARSNYRRGKPSRTSTELTMDDLSRRLLQLENQLHLAKRNDREPVYLLKSPKKRATGTCKKSTCKKRSPKTKRQLEDAPMVFNDNSPPSSSTGLWEEASPSTALWANAATAPVSTTYPDPQVLLKGVNSFGKAAQLLAQGPVVMKRQLVEGQLAERRVCFYTSP